MATMGFCGGILHVLNHAVFKGLLFLGAGRCRAAGHSAIGSEGLAADPGNRRDVLISQSRYQHCP
jgi:NADH:ubiquinone oxidoreductase subunit 5 (subunit L)/multisubunit Na+/H+ antiporter MnhA subunit